MVAELLRRYFTVAGVHTQMVSQREPTFGNYLVPVNRPKTMVRIHGINENVLAAKGLRMVVPRPTSPIEMMD